MAPQLRTYSKTKPNKSFDLFDSLFAKNIIKRKKSEKKKSAKKSIKKLEELQSNKKLAKPHELTLRCPNDTLHVEVNDTFDKLFNSKKYNDVVVKTFVINEDPSLTDTMPSISISTQTPVNRRKNINRRKQISIEKKTELDDKNDTFENMFSASLIKQCCNNNSHLNCTEVISSTPVVPLVPKRIIKHNELTPIANNITPQIHETLEEIRNWDYIQPNFENSLPKAKKFTKKRYRKVKQSTGQLAIKNDPKLKMYPRVVLQRMDFDLDCKGFDNSELLIDMNNLSIIYNSLLNSKTCRMKSPRVNLLKINSYHTKPYIKLHKLPDSYVLNKLKFQASTPQKKKSHAILETSNDNYESFAASHKVFGIEFDEFEPTNNLGDIIVIDDNNENLKVDKFVNKKRGNQIKTLINNKSIDIISNSTFNQSCNLHESVLKELSNINQSNIKGYITINESSNLKSDSSFNESSHIKSYNNINESSRIKSYSTINESSYINSTINESSHIESYNTINESSHIKSNSSNNESFHIKSTINESSRIKSNCANNESSHIKSYSTINESSHMKSYSANNKSSRIKSAINESSNFKNYSTINDSRKINESSNNSFNHLRSPELSNINLSSNNTFNHLVTQELSVGDKSSNIKRSSTINDSRKINESSNNSFNQLRSPELSNINNASNNTFNHLVTQELGVSDESSNINSFSTINDSRNINESSNIKNYSTINDPRKINESSNNSFNHLRSPELSNINHSFNNTSNHLVTHELSVGNESSNIKRSSTINDSRNINESSNIKNCSTINDSRKINDSSNNSLNHSHSPELCNINDSANITNDTFNRCLVTQEFSAIDESSNSKSTINDSSNNTSNESVTSKLSNINRSNSICNLSVPLEFSSINISINNSTVNKSVNPININESKSIISNSTFEESVNSELSESACNNSNNKTNCIIIDERLTNINLLRRKNKAKSVDEVIEIDLSNENINVIKLPKKSVINSDASTTNVETCNTDFKKPTTSRNAKIIDTSDAENAIIHDVICIDDTFTIGNSFVNKRRHSAIHLTPGKCWRRSLAVYKRNNIALDFLNNSCAGEQQCTCSKCKQKKLLESSVCRKSIRLLPTTRVSADCTIKSYVPNNILLEDFPVRSNTEIIVRNPEFYLSAKHIVLRRCRQTEPISFAECYPNSILKNCHKIGEGVYGEVFLFRNKTGGTSVMKVIPVEGDQMVNGEKQKKFDEIITEIIIAMELSNLRTNKNNSTSGFSEVNRINCVQGRYPERLLELWELYDEDKGSENDCPDIFTNEQIFIVLELANGGKDLESFVFNNALQAHSLFKQTACSLAVAESALKFEHRDLHWGNILISNVNKDATFNYCIDDKQLLLKSHGVEVSIIDFTLSRITTTDETCIYNDLGQDPDLFVAKGDYQFEIYRLMQKVNRNEWQHFEPHSNILWLHYTLDKMITAARYKNTTTKIHREYINKLKQIKEQILEYKSVQEYVIENFI